MVFDYAHSTSSEGMAENVVRNLRAFGGDPSRYTSPPEDILKVRYIDMQSGHQIMREDHHTLRFPLGLFPTKRDLVLISDYNRGWLTDRVIRGIKAANPHATIIVDTKRPDITPYQGCIVKLNEKEYDALSAPIPADTQVIVTKGADGAVKLPLNGRAGLRVPAPKVEVFDVTGAGDVWLAAYAWASVHPLFHDYAAMTYATMLATKSVEHAGTYTLQEEDIHALCC